MEEQRAMKKQGKLLAAAEDDNAGYDLLSRLPEPLVHNVLSFLTLKEIVKASVVCKSWGRIFSSFPVLDFRSQEFVGEATDNRDGVERMARFVDATMTRFQEQHLKIDKFGIDCDFNREWADEFYPLSRIDKWIGIALDNNAHEITIALPHRLRRDTPPPSLNLVALSGSTNLKSVTLDCEFLSSWGRLTSACGSLESLSLTLCHLKEVRISGLPNIKAVSITRCRPLTLIEIEAPSLESFSLNDDLFGDRTHPCVVNVNHSPNLRSLTLKNVAENDDWFRDFLSRFQLLRDLTVADCDSLSRIRISYPLIESIKVSRCTNLTEVSIEAPELRRLHLLTWDGLPSIRMEIPPRRKPVAVVTVCFHKQVEWPCKIREFLVGSCKSFSSLHLSAYTQDCDLELRNDIKYGWLGVIACNIEQLSLALRCATQEALPRAVDGTDVNGLIWTPHSATVTAVTGLSNDDFLQLFFDKVTTKSGRCSRESRKHCTSYSDQHGHQNSHWKQQLDYMTG